MLTSLYYNIIYMRDAPYVAIFPIELIVKSSLL